MALLHTHHYVLVLLTSLVILAALGAPPVVLLVLPALVAMGILAALLYHPEHRLDARATGTTATPARRADAGMERAG
ncbi:hypothetical protein [Nocardia sp. NPDC057030]|uniref:hypothetical protein n=1 Tax=unclassified Nocardia TaxID=2637762 RepID=UPI0036384D81